MSLSNHQNRDTAAWQILEYMQRNGSATIKDIEQLLGITTTAVRQHLSTLQAEGYIERKAVHTGVGRPHHTYMITEKVNDLFACHCDDLALTLLQEVFVLEGKERTGLLLERVSQRLANKYASSVRSGLLQERVEEMAAALYQRGVLTDIKAQAEDDTFVLHTYNCPYHELAQEHREICEMDELMLRQVLGSEVNLSSCMMDGHHSCSFVVSPKTDRE
ncbi:MAG: winged helix-turn-helix transcriptional regulator [Caldilineaceae bacterium]